MSGKRMGFRIPVDGWMPFVMIMAMFYVGRYGLMGAQRWENDWKVIGKNATNPRKA
jgi:hypothetical protein